MGGEGGRGDRSELKGKMTAAIWNTNSLSNSVKQLSFLAPDSSPPTGLLAESPLPLPLPPTEPRRELRLPTTTAATDDGGNCDAARLRGCEAARLRGCETVKL